MWKRHCGRSLKEKKQQNDAHLSNQKDELIISSSFWLFFTILEMLIANIMEIMKEKWGIVKQQSTHTHNNIM